MGARLAYAKVIDKRHYLNKGGRLHPGLENRVTLRDEPGPAAIFLVLRGWTDDHGTFTEQWRIESPGGSTVFTSTQREIYLATPKHLERLEDEVDELEFEFAAEDYTVVFLLDDMEVARLDFPVRLDDRAEEG